MVTYEMSVLEPTQGMLPHKYLLDHLPTLFLNGKLILTETNR